MPRQPTILFSLIAAASLALAMAACSDDPADANNSCVPGRSASCACSGGESGTQICADDGTFGACQCLDVDAGSNDVGPDVQQADVGPDAGPNDVGPDTRQPDTDPGPAECADGIDNDGDGLVDWSRDLGCWGPGDEETAQPRDQEAGWTTFDPSEDTTIIYVSASSGDDQNSGLSPDEAVKTLSKGYDLLEHDHPDWLLLKSGDTWEDAEFGNWSKAGASADAPMVVGRYGEGARPTIFTGDHSVINAFQNHPREASHVRFTGFSTQPTDRQPDQSPTGIRWLVKGTDVLFEDLKIGGYKDNITLQTDQLTDVTVRRCQIVDAWSTDSHAQGIYAAKVDGLVIEQNVLDHNGWNPDVDGAESTIFNHNLYIQRNNTGVTIRQNIIARASSHGLQLRPGGVADNNLFLKNALHMFIAGAGGSVTDNVAMYTKDIADKPRGFGLAFNNQLPETTMSGNIVAHASDGTGVRAAFKINLGGSDEAPASSIFRNNIAYDWRGGGLSVGEPDNTDDLEVIIEDNILQYDNQDDPARVVWSGVDLSAGFATLSGNRYYSTRPTDGDGYNDAWFQNGDDTYLGPDQWAQATGETGATFEPKDFPDPSRDIASYMQTLGEDASLEAFLTNARAQDRLHWDSAYTAKLVNDYIRAGFGR